MENCFPPLPGPENGINRIPVEDEYEEMTMDEIINGKVDLLVLLSAATPHVFIQGDSFTGLLGLVFAYIDTLDVNEAELSKIKEYLDLVKRRASGERSS